MIHLSGVPLSSPDNEPEPTIGVWLRGVLEIEGKLSPAELHQLEEVSIKISHDRRISLLSLVNGWAEHVNRLETEHSSKHASDPTSWTVWDYIAALKLRDWTEEGIASLPEPLGAKIRAHLTESDAKLRSFTHPDDDVFARFASEIADEDLFEKSWWWTRVPASGPVQEDLTEWARAMGITEEAQLGNQDRCDPGTGGGPDGQLA